MLPYLHQLLCNQVIVFCMQLAPFGTTVIVMHHSQHYLHAFFVSTLDHLAHVINLKKKNCYIS